MKKVLFVIHTLQVGGAERALINVLRHIDKSKYDITLLSIVDDGRLIKELECIDGIKYKYIFKAYLKKFRENKHSKLYRISKKIMNLVWQIYLYKMKYHAKELYEKNIDEKYDIEIAFLEGKVAKFVSQSPNKKSKKIAWIHTDITNATAEGLSQVFINLEEEKKCYRKFNQIVCVSDEVKNKFTEKTGIKKNIVVQVNPINSKEIRKRAKEEITRPLNRNGLIVCTVGRLVKEKGYDRLLEVHKRLISEGIIHTLWIVGEGREKDKLQEFINRNKLKNTVNLIGYTQNPYKFVKNSNIFVCSSRIEGLSTALIEATILEKAIITTNCPGTKEIFGENTNAALVVKNDTDSLYEGMKELLTNKKLMQELKKNIKNRSKIFETENTVKQIETVIDS